MSDDQIKTEDGAAKTEPNGGSNMAIFHATQRRVYSQPPTTIDSETRRQAAQQMDKLLMLINIAERLPIFSAEIIRDAEEGEAYEVLVRRIQGLHANIDEMAGLARETKYLPLSEDLCTNQEGSRPMKPE